MKKTSLLTILTFSICYCYTPNDETVSFRSNVINYEDNPQAFDNPLLLPLIGAYNDRVMHIEKDMSMRLKIKDMKFQQRINRYENNIRNLEQDRNEWQTVSCISFLTNCACLFFASLLEDKLSKNKSLLEDANKNPQPQKSRSETIVDSTANDCKLLSNKYIEAIKVSKD